MLLKISKKIILTFFISNGEFLKNNNMLKNLNYGESFAKEI